jgi:predicted RNase H-like HicB family nuclease
MRNGDRPKYEIVIFWDEQDKIFVADVPDLPGCMAHGKTQAKALKEITEVIELWLETARKYGDKIPKPRKHRLAA